MQTRNEIDNYLLFTNRKMTGGTEEKIRKHIQTETELKDVGIFGKEYINLCLNKSIYKDIIQKHPKLKGFDMPFEFHDSDIRDLIVFFHDVLPKVKASMPLVLDRGSIDQKNELNNLSKFYYENIIEQDLNRYHANIIDFLENPINTEYLGFIKIRQQNSKER